MFLKLRMPSTCWAMLSFMTMFPIWSKSCAREVMVVVAVAIFSTLRLHMRRSSSQSASPTLPHGATKKPGGGGEDSMPTNSLKRHVNGTFLVWSRERRFAPEEKTFLPKLRQENPHDFSHVYVDVDRKLSLWSIEIFNIIHLKKQ